MFSSTDKSSDPTNGRDEAPATAMPPRSINWTAIHELLDRVDQLPVLDHRTPGEIIGYNEFGLFDEEGDFSLTDIEVVKVRGR